MYCFKNKLKSIFVITRNKKNITQKIIEDIVLLNIGLKFFFTTQKNKKIGINSIIKYVTGTCLQRNAQPKNHGNTYQYKFDPYFTPNIKKYNPASDKNVA